MNFSRQALLGIGMIIGGSVMLYAMVQQIGDSNKPQPASAMIDKPSPAQESPQPLTTDIETEKRILAQKQKERAARVAEQENQLMNQSVYAREQALEQIRAMQNLLNNPESGFTKGDAIGSLAQGPFGEMVNGLPEMVAFRVEQFRAMYEQIAALRARQMLPLPPAPA